MPVAPRGFRLILAVSTLVIWKTSTGWADMPVGYINAADAVYGGGWNATDATAALQAAINTGQNVYVPKMASDWIVTPIVLKANQTILFEPGVVVAAKPGAFLGTSQSLFNGTNLSNVTLSGYGATLKMNKADYLTNPDYPDGEWRMGMKLNGMNNLWVEGFTIKDTGGDGIYLGTGTSYSTNVTIKDVRIDNVTRNGITIISGDGVLIDNAVVTNSGKSVGGVPAKWPKDGLDIEPNIAIFEVLKNITVKNSIFASSFGDGIAVRSQKTNAPVSITLDHVTIYTSNFSGIAIDGPDNLGGGNITIRDSLIVGYTQQGINGKGGTDAPTVSVDYNAMWQLGKPATAGTLDLGSHNVTGIQPVFYSLDPDSPWFMYLDPAISDAIALGSSTGSYIGARPVWMVPEPTGLTALLLPASLLVRWRRATLTGTRPENQKIYTQMQDCSLTSI